MTDKEIDKLAEEKFGFNSATESYKAWVEGFRAGFDTAQSSQKNELVIPDVSGEFAAFKDFTRNYIGLYEWESFIKDFQRVAANYR